MAYQIEDLLYLMSRLRDPEDGCPWDLKQTYASITEHTIEEAYELVDAIERNDLPHMREELGDLLFQVVFYAQIGKEQGAFDWSEIIDTLTSKLIRRHPHVFPTGELSSRASQATEVTEVKERWEKIKQVERDAKQNSGVLDDVPLALPGMTRAVKLQKRAAKVGFDWPDVRGALAKVQEEIAELVDACEQKDSAAMHHELGDILFAMANVARHLSIDPESAVRGTSQRFENRFRFIEAALAEQGKRPEQASLDEMDALWDEAKKSGC